MSSPKSETKNTQEIRDYTFNNSELGDGDGSPIIFNVAESPITGGVMVEYTDKENIARAFDSVNQTVSGTLEVLESRGDSADANARAAIDQGYKVTSQALEALRSVTPAGAAQNVDRNTIILGVVGIGVLAWVLTR